MEHFAVDNPEHFGRRLKMVRMSRCLPQRSFSAAVGMGQTSLSNVEIGKFVPADPAVREAIVRELGVRWDWLMNGSGLPFQSERGIEILNPCRKQEQQQASMDLITSLDCHSRPFFLDWRARFLAFLFGAKLFYVLLIGARTPLPINKKETIQHTIVKNFSKPKYYQITVPHKNIVDEARRMNKENFKIGDAFTLEYLIRYTAEYYMTITSKDSVRALKKEVGFLLNDPEFVKELRELTERFKNR
jgi:transcriptional regulator with XRE-family HTH domain